MTALSAETVQQLLRYEPETGKLFWKRRPTEMFSATGVGGAFGASARWNARYAEREAFTADDNRGYRCGRIFDKTYRAQRVIWAIQTGDWPDGLVDHADGQKYNNVWENLRLASKSENARNTGARADNACGIKGIYLDRRCSRWQARIHLHGRTRFLGSFLNRDDAAAAYARASAELHGEFGRVA